VSDILDLFGTTTPTKKESPGTVLSPNVTSTQVLPSLGDDWEDFDALSKKVRQDEQAKLTEQQLSYEDKLTELLGPSKLVASVPSGVLLEDICTPSPVTVEMHGKHVDDEVVAVDGTATTIIPEVEEEPCITESTKTSPSFINETKQPAGAQPAAQQHVQLQPAPVGQQFTQQAAPTRQPAPVGQQTMQFGQPSGPMMQPQPPGKQFAQPSQPIGEQAGQQPQQPAGQPRQQQTGQQPQQPFGQQPQQPFGQQPQQPFGQPRQQQAGQQPNQPFGQQPQQPFGQQPQQTAGQPRQQTAGQQPQQPFGQQPQPQQQPFGQPQQQPFGQQPQQPFGQPPQQPFGQPRQQPFGQPPQQPFGQPRQTGPPQQPFGQPPQQPFGQPRQQPFGQPPQQPFGQQPQQPFGQQPQQPFGQQPPQQPFGQPRQTGPPQQQFGQPYAGSFVQPAPRPPVGSPYGPQPTSQPAIRPAIRELEGKLSRMSVTDLEKMHDETEDVDAIIIIEKELQKRQYNESRKPDVSRGQTRPSTSTTATGARDISSWSMRDLEHSMETSTDLEFLESIQRELDRRKSGTMPNRVVYDKTREFVPDVDLSYRSKPVVLSSPAPARDYTIMTDTQLEQIIRTSNDLTSIQSARAEQVRRVPINVPLPPNWEAVVGDAGRMVYVNRRTGESSWTIPDSHQPSAPPPDNINYHGLYPKY
jgi:hypothetical protein